MAIGVSGRKRITVETSTPVPLSSRGARRLRDPSIVVDDRADATVLGEQRIAAESIQVQVERLVGLLLAIPLDFDRDRLRRLAGGEGQRAGPGDVVVVSRRG